MSYASLSSSPITTDRIVDELARIAFADIRDFVRWDASGLRLLDSDALTPGQAACVAEVVETSGRGVRVKLHGKLPALAALSRHVAGRESATARRVVVVTCVPEPEPPQPGDGQVPDETTGG